MRERHTQSCGNIHTGKSVRTNDKYLTNEKKMTEAASVRLRVYHQLRIHNLKNKVTLWATDWLYTGVVFPDISQIIVEKFTTPYRLYYFCFCYKD